VQRNQTVNDVVKEHFPVSLKLGLFAMLWAVVLGIPLGIIAALKQNTIFDYLTMAFVNSGYAVPNFLVARIRLGLHTKLGSCLRDRLVLRLDQRRERRQLVVDRTDRYGDRFPDRLFGCREIERRPYVCSPPNLRRVRMLFDDRLQSMGLGRHGFHERRPDPLEVRVYLPENCYSGAGFIKVGERLSYLGCIDQLEVAFVLGVAPQEPALGSDELLQIAC